MENLRKGGEIREILPVLVPLIYSKVFGRDLSLQELKTHLYLRDLDEEGMKEALSRIPGSFTKNEQLQTQGDPLHGPPGEVTLGDGSTQGSSPHGRSPGMEKAKIFARAVARLPFVQGIALCGSRTKGNNDPRADYDYFIITRENRLWVCWFFLVLLRKTRFRHNPEFDPNYLLDETELKIPFHSLFHAYEAGKIRPLYGRKTFLRFWQENPWIFHYLPNLRPDAFLDACEDPPPTLWRKSLEALLSGGFGTIINGGLFLLFWLYYLIRNPTYRRNLKAYLHAHRLHKKSTFALGYYSLVRKRFFKIASSTLEETMAQTLTGELFPKFPEEKEYPEGVFLFQRNYPDPL